MASLKHCQLCDEFTSTTLPELVHHLSLVHAHLPGFHLRCGLSGCQKEFRNILTYRNHIYAFHTDSHVSDPSQTNSDGGNSDLDDGELDQPLNLLVWTQIQFLAYQRFLTQIAFMVNRFKDWRPSTYSRSTSERISLWW